MASIDNTNTLQSVNLPSDPTKAVIPATMTNTDATSKNYDASLAGAQGYNAANINAQGYDAAQAGSTGYNPASASSTDWNVDNNQLASGRLDSILSGDSLLMRRAGAQGAQAANSRGLINSTMGVQAGQTAMIDAATPIAQSDASTYANAAQFNANAANTVALANQNAQNTASQFGANASNTAKLANQQATNTASQFNANSSNVASLSNQQAKNTASTFNANASNTAALQNAQAQNEAGKFNAAQDTQNSQFNATNANTANQFNAAADNKAISEAQQYGAQILMAQMDNTTKQLLQTSQTAASLYQTSQAAITAILTDANLTPDEKKAQVDSQVGMMKGGLSIVDALTQGNGNLNTNLRNLLNFDTSGLPSGSQSQSTMNAMWQAWSASQQKQGGGGGKGAVICTKLYQLGRLDKATFEADIRYAKRLLIEDPCFVLGYQMMAKPIAVRMHSKAWASLLFARAVEFMAMPIVRELAKHGGHGQGGGITGKIGLKVLIAVSRAVYKSTHQDSFTLIEGLTHGR